MMGWPAIVLVGVWLLQTASLGASDYPSTVRSTPGLIAYYRLEPGDDDPAGAVQVVGEVARGEASAHVGLGTAMSLGAEGKLRVPELGTHEAVSIELWLRLDGAPTEEIAAIYAVDEWGPGLVHLNLKAGRVVELAVNGAGGQPNSEPGAIEPGRWTHLVATSDGPAGELRLYLDGKVVAESQSGPSPAVILGEGWIGAWRSGEDGRPLAATIDEIAFYSRALSQAEVRRHFRAARGGAIRSVDFAGEIWPILEANCFDCHGPDIRKGGLRLDVRALAFLGGESGEPAIAPDDSEASHLIQLITSTDEEAMMPPEGPRLTGEEIGVLRAWIDQGAPWPDAMAGQEPPRKVASAHWSFQPVRQAAAPASDEPFVASGNPIDAFVFEALRAGGLSPSSVADRRTLIRRLYLDVLGLPPTPEEVARFEADESADAWGRLVDGALASPRYGERWASHWLDVIRYGDTHGFEVNTPRDRAWPYRDYVIKSLNDDMPYDRFIREQIAGDQLGVDAATGFLVAAPALLQGQVGKDVASIRQARVDELHEVIVTVGAGVMGLTVGCARCHNHKFDPISQRDYYQMQAVFAGVRYGERPLSEASTFALGEMDEVPSAVFAGQFSRPSPTNRLYRGDPMQRRERVGPDVPAVLGTLDLDTSASDAERRLALAEWLTTPSHPLTSRVLVNRVWQHHFGVGLVETPSDFGAMGVAPSHPELLDWLAATFVEEGWLLKRLHRLILLSNTYRQSSRPRAEGLAVDAASRLLWRFPPRRLEMEPIRDSILAVSGALDLRMGGPGFLVFKPNDNYVRVYDAREDFGPEQWRRMIYAHRVRMAQDGVFGAFDCPDAGQPAPKRGRSTTAIQALNLLNSRFVRQQAEILAGRATREAGDGRAECVRRVFALAYGREPGPAEQEAAVAVAERHGLAAVGLAVLNSNEFLFLP